jgi:hypothetical protein
MVLASNPSLILRTRKYIHHFNVAAMSDPWDFTQEWTTSQVLRWHMYELPVTCLSRFQPKLVVHLGRNNSASEFASCSTWARSKLPM